MKLPNRKDYCKAALGKLKLSCAIRSFWSYKFFSVKSLPVSFRIIHVDYVTIVRHLRVALSFCLKKSLETEHIFIGMFSLEDLF